MLDSVRLARASRSSAASSTSSSSTSRALTGWQSGAYWADRTPKDSLAAFRQAIGEANAGTVDCAALKGGPAERRLHAAGRASEPAGGAAGRAASRRARLGRVHRRCQCRLVPRVPQRRIRRDDGGDDLDARESRRGHDLHVQRPRRSTPPATWATRPRRSRRPRPTRPRRLRRRTSPRRRSSIQRGSS